VEVGEGGWECFPCDCCQVHVCNLLYVFSVRWKLPYVGSIFKEMDV